jgi:DNA polymerase III catalytic subunit, DnaE type
MKLVSMGFLEGFYYKPRIDYEVLSKHHEGLIGLSACLAGDIPRLLLDEQYDEAKSLAMRLNNIFGEGNFYLELQSHGLEEQIMVNDRIIQLSRETSIPIVATNDVHYVRREDAKAHDVLLCIQTGKTIEDQDRMKFETDEFYLKSPEEMQKLFSDVPEAIYNTVEIASRCNVEFDFNNVHLPKYDVPVGYTAEEYLRHLCYEGLERKYKKIDDEIRNRLEYELNTIVQMGYVDYF